MLWDASECYGTHLNAIKRTPNFHFIYILQDCIDTEGNMYLVSVTFLFQQSSRQPIQNVLVRREARVSDGPFCVRKEEKRREHSGRFC
jgi:hypothetical protein